MEITSKKPRLTKEAWLEGALVTLAHDGGAKLRIDTLTKELGVSKGSFYWHFENREEFVRCLLNYWHETTTLVVPQHLGVTGTAEERLLELIRLVFERKLTRYDLAIRSWAVQEPDIRPLVRRTDVFRLNFVRTLFEEMGFDESNADMRARSLVTYAAMYGAVFDQLSQQKQLDQIDNLHAMLVTPAG
jgi:AcrR family transcriptional regulator